MLNTQALDALAALASASAAPPAPSPSSVDTNHAFLAREMQLRRAAAEAQHRARHEAQVQAQAQARHTALASVPSDVLRAYLAASESPSAPRAVVASPPLHQSRAVLGRAPTGYSGERFAHAMPHRQGHASNVDASAIARILLAQRQQQQGQSQVQQQPTRFSPSLASAHAAPGSAPLVPTSYAPPALEAVPSLDLGPKFQKLPSRLQPATSPALQPAQSPAAASLATAASVTDSSAASSNAKAASKTKSKPKRKSQLKGPPKKRLKAQSDDEGNDTGRTLHSVMDEWQDKKEAKRAANRLSAHLSRKRKKMFLEDLKGENQELRRKEQILHAIPDLIVVFDSSGRMPFVSNSVTRFLDFHAEELQETSFWDRLAPESIKRVKSAFMDALATKRPYDEDSTPLWDGDSVDVRLLDRDDDEHLVSLKGVVHFADESPECVCSLRPVEGRSRSASDSSSGARHAAAAHEAEEGNVVADATFHRISDVESDGKDPIKS